MNSYSLRKGRETDLTPLATLLLRSWQQNYASFLPDEFLKNMDLSKQIERHRIYMQEKATYFIVEEGDNLIGFSSFGLNRDSSLDAKWELYTLYVDAMHHRKGLGKALLNKVCQEITDIEKGIAVWVMEENPFRSFYEKQGFRLQKKESFDFGGFEVKHVGYVKTSY